MDRIVLVTGKVMPRPVAETALLVDALERRGIPATVLPWDAPLDWSAVPLVVIRTPWDYVANRSAFLDWAGGVEKATRIVNPVPVLSWNSHKGYLVELAAAGVPVVETAVVAQGSSAAEQAGTLMAYDTDVVIKPAVSAGARGAARAQARSHAAAAHLAAVASEGDALIQPFQTDIVSDGEASLIFFAGRFSHAVRKVVAADDFRVQEHHGGTVLPHVPTAQQQEVAQAALGAAPGTLSYARVDLVGSRAPKVMELELFEPELFLGYEPEAADRFAAHLQRLLTGEDRDLSA